MDNNVDLGHVRLSIIDLSPNGNQPMIYDRNGRKAIITHNGEVYNSKDLRKELEERGHRFVSNTDTEVLLASYVEYGVNCVRRFNGMFAFVIYDVINSYFLTREIDLARNQ